MDKLSQVRGILNALRAIVTQGIYTDSYKGIEEQCISTYSKCVNTLSSIPGFEDIDELLPSLSSGATMQEIGFAVETVLSLVQEERGSSPSFSGHVKMARIPPIPPMPKIDVRRLASVKALRELKRTMKLHPPGRSGNVHGRRPSDWKVELELRNRMREEMDAERERWEEEIENIQEQIEELVDKISDAREELQDRLEEIREKYQDKLDELLEEDDPDDEAWDSRKNSREPSPEKNGCDSCKCDEPDEPPTGS